MNDADVLKKYLSDGEEVLWSKRPDYRIFNKYDLFSVPLCILIFGGILLFFCAYIFARFADNPAAAMYTAVSWLLVFIFTFYFLFGRFPVRKKRRSREIYCVTNKRAIVVTELKHENIESVGLSDAAVVVKGDSVCFTEENAAAELFYNLGLDIFIENSPKRGVIFRGIKDSSELLNIVKENQ